MTGTQWMLRIYRCKKCNNSGFVRVRSKEQESTCSLCGAPVWHTENTIYVSTVEEAQQRLRSALLRNAFERPGPKRGLGVKKRVYNIVASLVETNHGKPVTSKRVMQECSDANISSHRASVFLDQLEEEGLLIRQEGLVTVSGGDDL